MASGPGRNWARGALNTIAGATNGDTLLDQGSMYLRIYTNAPADNTGQSGWTDRTSETDGNSGNAVEIDFDANSGASDADPSVLSHLSAVDFGTITGGGYDIDHWGLWKSPTSTAQADFIAYGDFTATAIADGNTLQFAAGAIDITLG